MARNITELKAEISSIKKQIKRKSGLKKKHLQKKIEAFKSKEKKKQNNNCNYCTKSKRE